MIVEVQGGGGGGGGTKKGQKSHELWNSSDVKW